MKRFGSRRGESKGNGRVWRIIGCIAVWPRRLKPGALPLAHVLTPRWGCWQFPVNLDALSPDRGGHPIAWGSPASRSATAPGAVRCPERFNFRRLALRVACGTPVTNGRMRVGAAQSLIV